MFKKILLIIFVIAALSGVGYYLYHNVFNSQYEMTYELQRSKDGESCPQSYKFVARNDSVAAEKAVERLAVVFEIDNLSLEESEYRYQYKHLKLKNVTQDSLVRVPVSLIRKTFLADWALDIYKFNERDVDWLMFADTIPYFNYDMSIWLDNPFEEKHLRFIADNDYEAANLAIDTVAYYISNNWYYTNRSIDDIMVINNLTLEFVHSFDWNIWHRLTSSPYCEGIDLNRYPIKYRGLIY